MKKPEPKPKLSLDRETVLGPNAIAHALLSRLYPNLCRGGHG
jgi:hypothetical protein